MRAYLINPYAREVTEIEDPNGWPIVAMYEAIRRPDGPCKGLDHLRLNQQRDTIWVDDLGLHTKGVLVWRVHGYAGDLAGPAILVGVGPSGETTAPVIGIDRVRSLVRWTDMRTTGRKHPDREDGNHLTIGGGVLEYGGPIEPGMKFEWGQPRVTTRLHIEVTEVRDGKVASIVRRGAGLFPTGMRFGAIEEVFRAEAIPL